MSKLPMESRPIRLSPEVQKAIEQKLEPLNGKKLVAAQTAILNVYHSGKQQPSGDWVRDYTNAISEAVGESS